MNTIWRKVKDEWVALALVLGTLALAWIMLYPVFAPAPRGHRRSDLAYVKVLAFGLLMYASDWDERSPPAEGWFDRLNGVLGGYSYVARCAGLSEEQEGFGHALARGMPGTRLDTLEQLASTPLVFDSIDLSRNAVSFPSQMPDPGRNDGKNAIAYADGSARFLEPDQGR